MKITSFILLTIGLMTLTGTARAQKIDQCLDCHEGEDAEKKFRSDIHAKYGLSCADCHGGDRWNDDMDLSMSKAAGFIGVPGYTQVASMCARCHSDEAYMKKYNPKLKTGQYEEYRNSVHGEKTKEGTRAVANCVTCHGVHNITSVKSRFSPVHPLNVPRLCSQCHENVNYMKKYNPGLPTDQYQKYVTSVHGQLNRKGDHRVAECASCHNGHNIRSVKDATSSVHAMNLPKTCGKCHSDNDYMKPYGIPTDQESQFVSSVHGKALLEKGDIGAPACNDCHGNHGAVPVGIASISNVCGTCHFNNAELFSSSVHKEAFDRDNIPECEVCHGNHEIQSPTDDMLGVGEQSTCVGCHSEPDSKGYKAAMEMKALIDGLVIKKQKAVEALEEAERKGMNVESAKFTLADVKQHLIRARTTTHRVDVEDLGISLGPAYEIVQAATAKAQEAIDEYYFRRKGLGIATLFISVLVVALYLKIRQIEKRSPEDEA